MTRIDSPPTPPNVRLASTVALLRDGADGVEVLLLQRAQRAGFLGGAYVFPGGAVDPADEDARIFQRLVGFTQAEADTRLACPSGALRHWIAAARECFEEAGILLARDASGRQITPDRVMALREMRSALHRSTMTFADLLERETLWLSTDDLVYVDHWITPPGRSHRFDTRFFWARAPQGHGESADSHETVELKWLRPGDALAHGDAGGMDLPTPTRHVLRDIARWATVDEALADARARGPIEAKRPVVAQGARGPVVLRAGDTAYAEVRWSDPDETTSTTYDLTPGVPKRLDSLVVRVIAPNPGIMTGPGTNTYLVGHDELAVIDPGPDIDSHIEALVRAGADRIRWIFCTHTHRDHSPAAARLRAMTGARVIGGRAPSDGRQDADFRPDETPQDGATYTVGDVALRAIHTPGHASNHFCFLLERTGMLFSGDHVMQGSTVIINPPDGNMRDYLRSLEALLTRNAAIIAPGHGYLIGKPHDEMQRLIAHRMLREERVLRALGARGTATAEELVPTVYADVPADRHRAAARSLLAHLEKLVADGVVRQEGDVYSTVAGPAVTDE